MSYTNGRTAELQALARSPYFLVSNSASQPFSPMWSINSERERERERVSERESERKRERERERERERGREKSE